MVNARSALVAIIAMAVAAPAWAQDNAVCTILIALVAFAVITVSLVQKRAEQRRNQADRALAQLP